MKNAATLLASFSNTLNMINSNPFLTYKTKKQCIQAGCTKRVLRQTP